MSSVFLTNVDDYLAPSQACINPLFSEDANASKSGNASPTTVTSNVVVARRRVVRRRRTNNTTTNSRATTTTAAAEIPSTIASIPIPLAVQPTQEETKTPVEFSIADCLACSGCVTTAETVLVEQHSLTTLRSKCQEALLAAPQRRSVVFTISPASFSDLMCYLQIHSHYDIWARRLTTFLHRTCHASIVLDGRLPLQWSLTEAAHEFCHSYMHSHSNSKQGSDHGTNGTSTMDNDTSVDDMNVDMNMDMHTDMNMDMHMDMNMDENSGNNGNDDTSIPVDAPSVALSATQTQYSVDGKIQTVTHEPGRRTSLPAKLPVIASSCPALVCLVEKSIANAVRHLSSTKSPMAMAGTLYKTNDPNSLYVAVMPCHDKKLEASRRDLEMLVPNDASLANDNNNNDPDTDLVITTQELVTLLQETMIEQQHTPIKGIPSPSPIIEDKKQVSVDAIRTFLASMPLSSIHSSLQDISVNSLSSNTGGTFVSQLDTTPTISPATTTITGAYSPASSSPLFFSEGSGGYADYIFLFAARHLFGCNLAKVPWKPVISGRRRAKSARGAMVGNALKSDFHEAVLYQNEHGSYSCEPAVNGTSRVVLRFATAYGLQNVQRVLQPFKTNATANAQQLHGNANATAGTRTSSSSLSSSNPNNNVHAYDYVEAMACPSGCMNGGGQVQRKVQSGKRETPTETRQRVLDTQEVMKDVSNKDGSSEGGGHNANDSVNGNVNKTLSTVYNENLCPSGPFGEESQQLLHTRFHIVAPMQNATTSVPTVRDTLW